MDHFGIFAFLGMGAFALFMFLSVATWSDQRRREREAYYSSETLRKVTEMPGTTPAAVIEYVREQQTHADRRRREGIKVGGLVTAAAGVGLLIFFGVAPVPAPGNLIGIIPLVIGLALLLYAYVLAPRT